MFWATEVIFFKKFTKTHYTYYSTALDALLCGFFFSSFFFFLLPENFAATRTNLVTIITSYVSRRTNARTALPADHVNHALLTSSGCSSKSNLSHTHQYAILATKFGPFRKLYLDLCVNLAVRNKNSKMLCLMTYILCWWFSIWIVWIKTNLCVWSNCFRV